MQIAMPIARKRTRAGSTATAIVAAVLLAACGGGNPLSNPDSIVNPPGQSGQKLSFTYFQKYINPIFLTKLQVNQGGITTVATCSSGGCHETVNGTGGALRLVPAATLVTDLSDPAAVRATDMYKNFYSSESSTVVGAPLQSRLLNKPLVRGILHGGGVIFDSPNHPCAKLIEYWISNPMPASQDEFGSAGDSLTPPTAEQTQTCSPQ
jgi:hypothetical protein